MQIFLTKIRQILIIIGFNILPWPSSCLFEVKLIINFAILLRMQQNIIKSTVMLALLSIAGLLPIAKGSDQALAAQTKVEAFSTIEVENVEAQHQSVKYNPPVGDDVRVIFRSWKPGNRVICYGDDIGDSQFRIVMNTLKVDQKSCFWSFDKRTQSVRSYSNRNLALSLKKDEDFKNGATFVARAWSDDESQKVRFLGGKSRNIRTERDFCLDNPENEDNGKVHLWQCAEENTNQKWILASVKISKTTKYKQPVKDGVRFAIRNRMAGRRQLVWADDIGDEQYRLQLSNLNLKNKKGLWTFDSRTGTIRAWTNRGFALSAQSGSDSSTDAAAVLRKYVGNDQQIKFFGGPKQNLRNNAGLCLDVGQDVHKSQVFWKKCINGPQQGFSLATLRVIKNYTLKPENPLKDGKRFLIRSRMSKRRMLVAAEDIGDSQLRLRIVDINPRNQQAFFQFDSRTHTIRQAVNKKLALSMLSQADCTDKKVAAVLRKYSGDDTQNVFWYPGSKRNIRSKGGKCLDVGRDKNKQIVNWTQCHNGPQQGFQLSVVNIKHAKDGEQEPENGQDKESDDQPEKESDDESEKDTEKKVGDEPVEKDSKESGDGAPDEEGSEKSEKEDNESDDEKDDQPSKKSAKKRSSKGGKKSDKDKESEDNEQGNELAKEQESTPTKENDPSAEKPAKESAGEPAKDPAPKETAPQPTKDNEPAKEKKASKEDRKKSKNKYPLKNGVKFQIKTRMGGNRALFWHEDIGGGQFKLRIQDNNPDDKKQWWVFNQRTQSIRAYSNKNLAISNEAGQDFNVGRAAVIRPWKNELNQKVKWVSGIERNIQNRGGKCLEVLQGKNANNQQLTWSNCHEGRNQAWFIDRQVEKSSKYPFRDGMRFQIKSKMDGSRAVFWAENIGLGQHQLRIRDNNPSDNQQWWVFNQKTQTIRAWADRRLAISSLLDEEFNSGRPAVARHWRGKVDQRIKWSQGKRNNIQNSNNYCLDVQGGSNTNNQPLVWFTCNKELHQAWYLDEKAFQYPKQPLKDKVKFQLKTRMQGHRALYWAEQIGGNQFRLRIRDNNPSNNRQWWQFDSRSHTIRAFSKPYFVISNQFGVGYSIGYAAVIRQWKAEQFQKLSYHPGKIRNLRNNGQKCLDVWGGYNWNNQYLTFWDCHNGPNQGWIIDQNGLSFPKFPVNDGVKFQIKTKMDGNRALFWNDHIGGDQYRLRIRDNQPLESKQWFVHDNRTRTIRTYERRDLVIANQQGYEFAQGVAAVVRPYRKEPYVMIGFYNGTRKNIRNGGGLCLDVYGNSNVHYQPITFWACHNELNQAWFIDSKGVEYPKNPLKDGVKFQIKSKMPDSRAVYWSEDIGGRQFRLRIRSNTPSDIKQWWVFDSRTHTIRAFGDRRLVISNQEGYLYYNGYAAVAREWKGETYQKLHYHSGPLKNLQNNGGQCLEIWASYNIENWPLSFWTCHDGINQGWNIVAEADVYPIYPLADEAKFQIRSKMDGNRAILWAEDIGGEQYRLRIRSHNPFNKRQWWKFDTRTRTIRAFENANLALSNQRGVGYEAGHAAVARAFTGEEAQKIKYAYGDNKSIQNKKGKCLAIIQNTNNMHLTWKDCQDGEEQAWYFDQREFSFPKFVYQDEVKFQIKTRMQGNRALFWNEEWYSNQFVLRIRDNDPGDKRQWFIHDSRTRTIRPIQKRDYVITNQLGYGFAQGVTAVVRPYTKQVYEKIGFFSGPRKNLRNAGGFCFEVQGSHNVNNHHTTFMPCTDGLNQAWHLDRKGIRYPKQPLKDGVKFQIKSKMEGNRAVFWSEDIGGEQYRLRIRDNNPANYRQWWLFDSRTHTIRAMADRRLVICIQAGYGFNNGVPAVIRPYKGENFQRIQWNSGPKGTIRNNGRKCLDVAGNQNHNNALMIWWDCHNGPNQAFFIQEKGNAYPKTPFKDGLKFQIKSRYPKNRALYWAEDIGGQQYRLRIRNNNPFNSRQWWKFDSRTHTIRAWTLPTYVISMQAGQRFNNGGAAVVREWKGESNQKIQWHDGPLRNLRNNGGQCLDIQDQKNVDKAIVQWWTCHTGQNQAWYLDQLGIRLPRPDVKGTQEFEIKTIMPGNRAIFWHDAMRSNQFKLRIRDNDPSNKQQWWFYDSRTKTIRASLKKTHVIANQLGFAFTKGRPAVIRPYKKEPYVLIGFYPGQRRNIRNGAGLCLDVWGGKNENNQRLTWWPCHDGLNQGWTIKSKMIKEASYPLKSGQKFQIKTKMEGHRALFWDENIGEGQYRLRIRDSRPDDNKQWWLFDSRTHTIRAMADRRLVISNQAGQEFNIGRDAVVRKWKRQDTQRIYWRPGPRRNLRNHADKCLDVYGGKNENNQHLTWWNCHDGLNQAWSIVHKTSAANTPKQPLKDGVKFQIKTRMEGNRPLFFSENIGGKQYRLRIRDNKPVEGKQWWKFDSRTQTIRAWSKQSYAISNQIGFGFQNGRAAVIRPWKGENFQKINWHNGNRRNIRNNGKMCLDVWGGKNEHNQQITWWTCHNGLNQAWFLDQKGYQIPKAPLKNGVKFQLKTAMASRRALYWNEHIGGKQYRLRIRNNDPGDQKQWWVFDSRTKTIRAYSRRDFCIGNEIGARFTQGKAAVIRPYRREVYVLIGFYPGQRRNIRNAGNQCLDVWGGKDEDKQQLTWWPCHDGLNQAWTIDKNGIKYPKYPKKNGLRFQIKTRMTGNMALFWSEHIGGGQYRLRIRNTKPSDNRQWWLFDSRTHTIRAMADRRLVISNQADQGFNVGMAAVVRNWKGENQQRIQWHSGKTGNIRNNGDKCLDVLEGKNENKQQVTWQNCHNSLNQAWLIDTKAKSRPKQPLANGVKFQLKTRMNGNRALFWAEDIGTNQFRLRIRDNNPSEGKQWWKFDSRTKTIRAYYKPKYVISNQAGQRFSIGRAAVIRPWLGENYQRLSYVDGQKRNIRNRGGKCLDVYGGKNENNQQLTWWTCHNGLNQAWIIDQQGVSLPRPPIRDGLRFQIKTKMTGVQRAVFWNDHIGEDQFRLRIRNNNPSNKKQWWVFDSRTKSIRAYAKRTHAISNEDGQQFKIGRAAVIRPYKKHSSQMVGFYKGKRRNIRNAGGKCLDVYGGKNLHNQQLTWWDCHNGLNQAFVLDRKGQTQNKNPIPDGVKFQIKTRLEGNRALFWKERIRGNQYRLRIRDNNPSDNKQWWVFDSRTRSIRAFSRRSHSISNQAGYGFKIGRAAVIRPFTGRVHEQISFFPGARRNLRNHAGKCLDVWGGKNENLQKITWWTCHNGLNQAWFLVKQMPVNKNIGFKSEKSFRIQTSEKRVFFVAERLKKNQYRLRIRAPRNDDRELFFYDFKTKTIRFKKDSRFVLSLEEGPFQRGRKLVVRPFRGKNDQRFFYKNKQLHNFQQRNLCPAIEKKDVNNAELTLQNCFNGKNGKFLIKYTTQVPKARQPFKSTIKESSRFNIVTQEGFLVTDNRINTNLKIGEPGSNKNGGFMFDGTFNAIRLGSFNYQRYLAVENLQENDAVTIKKFKGSTIKDQDRFFFSPGDGRLHNFKRQDLCIQFNNPKTNNDPMVLAKCDLSKNSNQKFKLEYVKLEGSSNGFKPWQVFKIRNLADKKVAIRVSNDGSMLLPTQRYAKIQYPAQNKNDERYFWDPKVKCLRNFQYSKGCMSYVKQGTSYQLIALEDTENAGIQPHDIVFDGKFLIAMDQVVAPQTNLGSTNGIYVSLTQPSFSLSQMWSIQYSNKFGNRHKPVGGAVAVDTQQTKSWNFGINVPGFEIRTFSGKVLYIDQEDMRVKVRSRLNNVQERFFYDTVSKTIKWQGNSEISIAAEFQKDGSYKLIGRKTQGSAPEWFTRPNNKGVVMLSANKNFIWRAPNKQGGQVEVIRGQGDKNWKKNGTYFTLVNTTGPSQAKTTDPSKCTCQGGNMCQTAAGCKK